MWVAVADGFAAVRGEGLSRLLPSDGAPCQDWLQRFQRVGVKEEVDQADVADTIVVAVGGRVLPVNHHFLEVVACMFEREGSSSAFRAVSSRASLRASPRLEM